MSSRGQLLDNSPVPSTVADSGTNRTTPIGPPFLDIMENNQAAEEALEIVEAMASQEDRAKSVAAVASLAKYRQLAEGEQAGSKESVHAKAVVSMVDDFLAARK